MISLSIGDENDYRLYYAGAPATGYAAQKIRLALDLGLHGRWKQIDAVQLAGE